MTNSSGSKPENAKPTQTPSANSTSKATNVSKSERTEPNKRTISYSSIEATLRGAGVLENPVVLQALKLEAGIDTRRPQQNYDWQVVKILERIVPEKLGWQGTSAEKLYRLGCCTFNGWGETIIGRVLTAPLGKATSARSLELMARNLSLNPAFGSHQLNKLNSTSYVFTATDDPRRPEFVAGLLVPVLERTGAAGIDWQAISKGVEAYEISIKWADANT